MQNNAEINFPLFPATEISFTPIGALVYDTSGKTKYSRWVWMPGKQPWLKSNRPFFKKRRRRTMKGK